MSKAAKSLWCALMVTAVLLLGGLQTAHAVLAHVQPCTDCHRGGANPRALTNLCVNCHVGGIVPGQFDANDASDAMGSHPGSPSGQTSHYWGGSPSAQPAAGATTPAYYYSRYQISTGRVTCSICHDPHLDKGTKLLRKTDAGDLLCQQCHAPFFVDNAYALLTHPVGTAVAPTADPLKFNATPVNVDNGDVRLLPGTPNYVSCTSCHSTHFADSNSSSLDGMTNYAGLQNGDGFILRTDGPQAVGATPQETADKRSAVCTACHPYKTHGNDTEPVGCLVCHSAHVYNGGTANYFVLRNAATTTAFGTVTGLTFTATPPVNAAAVWADGNASTATGYCEKCHGNLPTMAGSGRAHTEGENCRSCHVHNKSGAGRSFEGSGCDGCHGYPPATNVATTGYAVDSANGYNYTTSGVFKDESLTPHPSHSGTSSPYNFSCSTCHNANFLATHDKGTFQNVLDGTGTFSTIVKPTGSGLNPAYNPANPGTCTSVACHSNGGKRTGDGTHTYVTTSPTWTGTKGSISTCNACHGNDATSMGVGQRNNSTSHIKHLNQGYSCNTCHASTAVNANTLASGAEGVYHVNGTVNVVFGGIASGSYNNTAGTCSVNCHGANSPDWDLASTGACGTCHQVNSLTPAAGGVATGSGTVLGGAHAVHVYDAGGLKLACTTCHTNNGSGSDHVNGAISLVASYQTAVCNPCHGATNGVSTGDDRQPIWNTATSVDCQTCHIGVLSTINTKTAPPKNSALTAGHGKTSGTYASGKPAANKTCTFYCHDENNVTGHLDGITSNATRLVFGFACDSCHGSTGNTAQSNNMENHKALACATCHDPHGTSNIYMVNTTSANFNGTVAFTALTGSNGFDEDDNADGGTTENNADDICATCHSSLNGIDHNNKQNTDSQAPTGHNLGTNCLTACHKPHTDVQPFSVAAGSNCNGCHGFPPATGAHRTGTLLTDPELHSVTTVNTSAEDRTDCAVCHTGADLYTYSPSADQSSGTPGRTNHGVGDASQKAVLTAAVGYNTSNFTCASACHASTAVNGGAWTATTGLSCDACHYYDATPTTAENTAAGAGNTLTGNHGKHFGTGGVTTCDSCHTVPNAGAALSGPLAHITTGTGTDLAKIQSRAAAAQDDATVLPAALGTGSDADPGNPTCNIASCHNPSGTTYSATWNVSTSSCTLCHSATNPGTGSHGQHMNAATTFGMNTIVCTTCHANNGTNMAHRTGSVNLLAGMSYTAGAVDVLGTVGTCTTSTCHNNGTAAATAVVTPNWGQASADCTICHGNGPTTGEHAKHANVTFVAGSCTDCHTAANTTSHINGVRNISNKITDMDLVTAGNQLTAPGGWVGTCTNNCHIANTTGDWTAGTNTLACTDCHGSGKVTTPAMDRGWTTTLTSGAHQKHINSGSTASYVNAANCTNCHNDNSVTHSTLNNVITSAVGTAVQKISANPGNGSCTNTCHAAAEASDWTGGSAAIACQDCHAGTYIGGGANIQTSGLHAVTPTISGQRHDQTVSGGCAACHNTLSGLGSHLNGVFTGDTMTNLGLRYYTQTSANIGTCVTTTCHKGVAGGTSDDWVHKWMAPANYTNSTSSCAGCHGDWNNTWNSGIIHKTAGNVQTQHGANAGTYKCKDCHNLSDTTTNTGYTFVWNSNDWGGTSTHGDGQIQVNSNGSSYNTTTFLCSPCHLTADGHEFVDSGWNVTNASGTAITVTCGACHDGGVVDFGTPWATPGHTSHSAGTGALVDGGAACTPCHGDNTGLGYHNGVGVGVHGNGIVNFVGVTYSTAVRNDLTGTCLTSQCHNKSTGTNQSNTWSATQLECDDCHYYATGTTPTQAGNAASSSPMSADHGTHFGTGGTFSCSTCHGTDPVAGDTSHIGGNTSLVDKSNATQDECTVIVSTWDDVNNTCANTACHNPSNTTYKATWQVDTSSCALCHADNLTTANPGTGDHTDHMTRSAVFGRVIACSDCHAIPASNRHSSGAAEVQVRNVSGTFGAVATPLTAGGCGTNECHNNGAAAAPKNSTYQWGNAVTITDCLECHENGTTMATNAHNEHMNAGYTGAACTDCHTAATATTHMDRFVKIDTAKSTYSLASGNPGIAVTPNGTCSTTSCHNRGATGQPAQSIAWNVATGTVAGTTDLTCNSCHGDATAGLSTSHADHITAGKTCAQCHDTLPTTTTHITLKTSMIDGAVAAPGESSVTFANAAAVTDYTYSSSEHSCYTPTNNGLGCHATAGAAGAADATRPDWDAAFDGTNGLTGCIACHTNTTTAAVNPTSGLHNVTPSISAKIHNQTVDATNGCKGCHNTMPQYTNHKNGTFNGDTTGDLGLRYYTQTAANTGTCATTTCHLGQSDGWAHKWDSTANYYTTAATACLGCHGDLTGGFNAGVDHRNTAGLTSMHGGTGTYKCQECHAMERGVYPFTFGTADWAPLNAGNKHGNNAITMNDDGTATTGTYTNWQRGTGGNSTKSTCVKCHGWADATPHDFVNTTWAEEQIAGATVTASCGGCHGTAGVTPTTASGAHTAHGATAASVAANPASIANCIACHGNDGTGATHNNGTVNFVGPTYSTAVRNDLTGTCTNATCHYGSTTPAWNTVNSTTCTSCHNDGSVAVAGAIAEAWPSKNKNGTARSDAHSSHVLSGLITVAANCTDCHGDNTTTHSDTTDGTIVINNKISAYTTGTCTNTCHGGTTADFTDKTPTVVCVDCHATGKIGSFVTTSSSHTDADGTASATYTTSMCEACHGTASNAYKTAHADGTTAANDVEIPTTYTTNTLVPTMNKQYAGTSSKIRLGGTATSAAAKTTEAEICWSCHDSYTTSYKTLSGTNVAFTNPATITATGIESKFAVGDWITITGSATAANNRTFKVATVGTGSLTVTIQTGDAALTTATAAAGITIVSPLSEWGVNENAATGSSTYDYGYLTSDNATGAGTLVSNWFTGGTGSTTAVWRSGKGRVGGAGAYNPYWYKRGALKSTHAANFDNTKPANVEGTNWKGLTSGANTAGYNRTEALDAVANVRCTYCHDVHGTHDTINGDTAGAPYLRGTWKGNPYAEDGAPQWGMESFNIQGSSTANNNGVSGSNYGIVPRASAWPSNSGLTTVAKVGGFWIDQNSGNPNSGATATGTSGLCQQCHGGATKNGTWTAADLGTIDQITGEGLWVSGWNGHANSVISAAGGQSGTAPAAASAEIRSRNIFTRTLRGYSTATFNTSTKAATNMGLYGESSGYSYRGSQSGYLFYPRVANTTATGTTTTVPYAFRWFAWNSVDLNSTRTRNSIIATGTLKLTQPTTAGAEAAHDAQLNYHTFTCSKCHNPHASRLPKLMITNCLDTNHNTWEDRNTYTYTTALPTPWTGVLHSNFASAQNCHRVDARAVYATSPVTTLGKGWNFATPWQETTTPFTQTATNPNP